uniref:CDAN1-interacting nuclease 1 n=1 Tax=viral metagenome TaxID=1070528 RepID=A0A6C0C854_9ZZZZ
MQRFDYSVTDDNTYHIQWINLPIQHKIYTHIKKMLSKSNDYTILNKRNERRLLGEFQGINKYYGTNIKIDQYISLRNTLLKQKMINNYYQIKRRIGSATDEYNGGENIMILSKRYDHPPCNLLKSIFICQGYDELSINKLFRLKMDDVEVLSVYDCKQYGLAERFDIDSMTQQLKIAEVATSNEILFVDFFKKMGINLSTQEELVNEQMESHGRAVVTPDILFIDVIYINKVRIHWLEYKDYACTTVQYLLPRNIKQVEKYTKTWGTGAICYNHSFVDNISIPGTVILDATALGINFA